MLQFLGSGYDWTDRYPLIGASAGGPPDRCLHGRSRSFCHGASFAPPAG